MSDLKEDEKKAEEILDLFADSVGVLADASLGDRYLVILGVGIITEKEGLQCLTGVRSGESFPTQLSFKLIAELNTRSVDTIIEHALKTGEMEEPT